jgi:hypothetical protein
MQNAIDFLKRKIILMLEKFKCQNYLTRDALTKRIPDTRYKNIENKRENKFISRPIQKKICQSEQSFSFVQCTLLTVGSHSYLHYYCAIFSCLFLWNSSSANETENCLLGTFTGINHCCWRWVRRYKANESRFSRRIYLM